MARTIALTGGTGFIGSTISKRLLKAGYQVRALARPASDLTRLAGYRIQWIKGDLSDQESLRKLVLGSDAVVHCAGAVRGVTEKQFDQVNVDGVARMVQAAKKLHPLPRFLLISSLAAKAPNLSIYAASKRKGEVALESEACGVFWAIFRPCAVYGPGDREMLPLFRWIQRGVAPVFGADDARFSLLFVDDLAEAVLQWLEKGYRPGSVFELHDGTPGGYTWDAIIEAFSRRYRRRIFRLRVPAAALALLGGLNLLAAEMAGYRPMLTPGKVRELLYPNWVCSNHGLSREIGWIPQIGLEEGLGLTLSWPGR
jgi:nucleoside-diphosphate-sugar epimerase